MQEIPVIRLFFELEEDITFEQTHHFRGYIAKHFMHYEILHNHDLKAKKSIRIYPKVQYKILHNKAIIVGIGKEAVDVSLNLYQNIHQVQLQKKFLRVVRKVSEVSYEQFGISDQFHQYQFETPWIGLNSANYTKYQHGDEVAQQEVLRKCIIGNILGFAESLLYSVTEEIVVEPRLLPQKTQYKGNSMISFQGSFATNFILPVFFGIGKGCSRGYGCLVA